MGPVTRAADAALGRDDNLGAELPRRWRFLGLDVACEFLSFACPQPPGSSKMKSRFKAVLIQKSDQGQTADDVELTQADLMEGDVTVAVSHSTVNYKDGLALTGRSPVVRKFPLIPGIDFAGTVAESSNPNFKPGDKVVLNGYGLGETHHGGYCEIARVKGDWLVPLPDAFTPAEAMAIGTAGYTAMLAVMA